MFGGFKFKFIGRELLVPRLMLPLQHFGHFFGVVRAGRGGSLVLFLDGEIDLFPMDFRFLGGFDTEADLLSFDLNDYDFDVVVDGDAFAQLPGQY